ncbi:hypothetical protein Tco_0417042, partial [Tanacetum coccineum]
MVSEFVALATTGKEAEWLRNLIFEIPLWSKPIALISIHYDSAATLSLKNPDSDSGEREIKSLMKFSEFTL